MNSFKEHLNESRIEKRKVAVDKAREYVEDLAKELANEYDTYEPFAKHMKKLIPQMDVDPNGTIILPNDTGPIHMSLKWMWERYNEVQHQRFKDSWDQYGEERARGEHTSRDGWTGD